MNILTKLGSVLAAVVLTANPSSARIEHNTDDLLSMVSKSGVDVTINTSEYCRTGHYLGVYAWTDTYRSIHLCPGDTIDPIDHATVRHEVMHSIQHCVNINRQTSWDTPVLSPQKLKKSADIYLTRRKLEQIAFMYETDELPIEIEAFVAQELYTATQLMTMYQQHCVS